jgi:hypothetical protein
MASFSPYAAGSAVTADRSVAVLLMIVSLVAGHPLAVSATGALVFGFFITPYTTVALAPIGCSRSAACSSW